LIEIDAASNTSVEDVRDLRDKINFSPNQGTYKVYIIDEVHMLSTAAFNALLKTLEEPPPHAIFILATTEMHKIPATVLSRCQRHEFRRVPVDNIVEQLQHIAESEGLQAKPEALTLIARQASGGMRDAISLLDQMASTGQEITLGLTQTVLGTATSQAILELVGAIQERNPAAGMNSLHTSLDAGTDPRLLARQVVDYMRALLLLQMGNTAQVDLSADTKKQAAQHAKAFTQAEVVRMIKAFNVAATDLRGGWQPALPLELALAEVMELPAVEQPPVQQPPARKAAAEEKPAPAAKSTTPPVAAPKATPEAKTEKKPSAAAPQTPAPESKTQPKPEVKSVVSLEQVSKAWKQIRVAIKGKSLSLEALLNSGKLLDVKENVLVIGFQSEILRSKVDTPEQMKITRQAILDVMKVELGVRCVVTTARNSTPPDVKADGMVAAALRHGGESWIVR
jgi:DNA polymerase-3 subunit gamma/tau